MIHEYVYEKLTISWELELELIQTQMAQKPMLRAEVYAHAIRASQNRKKEVRKSWALQISSGTSVLVHSKLRVLSRGQ